jgi:hypothetical protein
MSTTAVIVLGIVVWVLVSVPAALVVARMIRLRDQREQGLVDFGSDGALPVRRELLSDGVAALVLGLNDPPDVIAGQVGGPAGRGLCGHAVVAHVEDQRVGSAGSRSALAWEFRAFRAALRSLWRSSTAVRPWRR